MHSMAQHAHPALAFGACKHMQAGDLRFGIATHRLTLTQRRAGKTCLGGNATSAINLFNPTAYCSSLMKRL